MSKFLADTLENGGTRPVLPNRRVASNVGPSFSIVNVHMNRLLASDVERVRDVMQRGSRDRHVSITRENLDDGRERQFLQMLQRIMLSTLQVTRMWSAALFLADGDQQLRLRQTARIDSSKIPIPDRSLREESPDVAALAGEPVIVNRSQGRWLPEDAVFGFVIPIVSSEKIHGTLWCYERRTREVNSRSRSSLLAMGAQLASVLERQNLVDEPRLQSAKLQRAPHGDLLWPDRLLIKPTTPLQVAVRTESAEELSGDVCDVIHHESGLVTLVIGDVVGSGIEAAMLSVTTRGILRGILKDPNLDPRESSLIMNRLNQVLIEITAPDQFVSMTLVSLDFEARQLFYTNAGHPASLLMRNNQLVPLKSHGLLAGIAGEVTYQRSAVAIGPHDTLVMFTDGLTETMDGLRRILHTDGILLAVKNAREPSAEGIAESIWLEMRDHQSSGRNPAARDDRTLIVARMT